MSGNQYDARMLSPQAREDLRRRVVHAVVEQGMRPAQAVRVFRVSRTAVYDVVRRTTLNLNDYERKLGLERTQRV